MKNSVQKIISNLYLFIQIFFIFKYFGKYIYVDGRVIFIVDHSLRNFSDQKNRLFVKPLAMKSLHSNLL